MKSTPEPITVAETCEIFADIPADYIRQMIKLPARKK